MDIGTRRADATASLLDAVLRISTGGDLRGALDRLVQASCDLTGARYGVLGILDEDSVVSDFVIHGVDAETIAKIASLPTCQGVLGVLVEDACPLRLTDVADHARSMGFPPNHPPMKSFLGVPVLVDGEVYGNLYLTEKAGGTEFSAEDESLLSVLAQIAGFVIANARARQLGSRRQRWLESSIAMGHELQGAGDVEYALGMVASRLREVAEARLVVVAEHLDPQAHLVAADCGEAEISLAELTSLVASAEVALATAAADGEVVVLARPGGSSLFVVPLLSRLVPGHSLLVELPGPGVGIAAADTDLLAAFADQAALALDRTQGVIERQQHMLVADRDRIARDLHDTVIQRLFATGLQLQGIRRTLPEGGVSQRLDDAVGELSTTIRDIRSTIFELKHDEGVSLKSEIRGLARDYVPVLGFAPFVRIRGPLDRAVSPETAEHLIATLREALSNVARHSNADACVIEVEVGSELLLRVADNGRGIAASVVESGLQNLRLRAVELGGQFRMSPDEPQGTVLEWRVPLG